MDASRDTLLAIQRKAFEDELERLEEDHPDLPSVAPPDMPAPFLGLLVRALALAENEGDAARAATLRHYHLDLLQRRRVAVLSGRAEPRAMKLLSTPLELARCPRLFNALARLDTLLGPASRNLRTHVDGKTFAEIYATCFYGRYAPPLGTSDQELAAIMDEAAHDELLTVLDRRLAGPLFHELTHLTGPIGFVRPDRQGGHGGPPLQRRSDSDPRIPSYPVTEDRDPLMPPYLDECIAAALGARAMPALICPDEADHLAMVGAPWFVQVGEHLFLAFGFEPIIAAHAGHLPWSEVLPENLVALFAELGWQQYLVSRHVAFLGEAQLPDPWVKLIHLARMGRLDLLDEARLKGGVALYDALRELTWDTLDAPPVDGSAMRPAFERSMLASPRLGPRGAWRVTRAQKSEARWDPTSRSWVSPRDATGLEPRWVVGPVTGLALP